MVAIPGNGILKRFGRQAQDQPPAVTSAFPEIEQAATQLFEYKKQALHAAREEATQRGDSQTPALPTLVDYFIAAIRLGESHANEMQRQGIQWTPRVIADLSGQQIEGFSIQQDALEPSLSLRTAATLGALESAHQAGRSATLIDMLEALQHLQHTGTKREASQQMLDLMQENITNLRDAAGPGGEQALHHFFAEISSHCRFENTRFENVTVSPASSLMRDGHNGAALTENAHFHRVTFDGLHAEDTLTLKRGNYQDISFTHLNGGTIIVADGTEIEGMNLKGAQASLKIGNAKLSKLDATGAHIVTLEASAGAILREANFSGTTIDMASNLNGSIWKSVNFHEANLGHVDLRGAELNEVRFTKTDLQGLDLRGAKLINLEIDGQRITKASELEQYGIVSDASTFVIAHNDLHNKQLAQIRATMQRAMASLPATTSSDPPSLSLESVKPQGRFMVTDMNMAEVGTATDASKQAPSPVPDKEPASLNLSQVKQAGRFEVSDSNLSGISDYNAGRDATTRTQPEAAPSRPIKGRGDA